MVYNALIQPYFAIIAVKYGIHRDAGTEGGGGGHGGQPPPVALYQEGQGGKAALSI